MGGRGARGGGGTLGRRLGRWDERMLRRACVVVALFFLTLLGLFLTLSSPASVRDCPEPPPPPPCPHRKPCPGEGPRGASEQRSAPAGGPRLCLVVPFRDRFEELQIFAPHMDAFLRAQGLSFTLLVLNQLDVFRFNRAALVNAGFWECERLGADYMGMQDVDLLPKNPGLSYAIPSVGHVRHVASPQYHPRYNYTNFIGGILLLRMEDYRAVDGMSNRYWGWGLEDDEFFLRLKEAGLGIQRPQGLNSSRKDTFQHVHDRRLRPRDTGRCGEQRRVSRRRDRTTGLASLRYRLLSRSRLTIDDVPVHVLNVQLHCDLDLSPWCQRNAKCAPNA